MRGRLVERQVYAVTRQIGAFVDYLGLAEVPPAGRPPSPVAADRPLFAPPAPMAPGALPELAPAPVQFSALYILDYLTAFQNLAIDNAGHAAGRDVSPQRNARLGQILAKLAAGSGAEAKVHG